MRNNRHEILIIRRFIKISRWIVVVFIEFYIFHKSVFRKGVWVFIGVNMDPKISSTQTQNIGPNPFRNADLRKLLISFKMLNSNYDIVAKLHFINMSRWTKSVFLEMGWRLFGTNMGFRITSTRTQETRPKLFKNTDLWEPLIFFNCWLLAHLKNSFW